MADSSEADATATPIAGETDALDDRIAVLADARRRQVLAHLADAPDAVAVEDLVDRLVASDVGTTPLADDPDHVTSRLHHVHLPKLADAGFVAYDEAAGRVTPTEACEQVAPLLDVA